MDHKLFTTPSTGQLVRIPRDPNTGNEYAFMPTSLPPKWEFPAKLWPLLAEAKHQLGLLEGIGRGLPNPGILLRLLEDREAINSSRLEGTYVTATELLVFEMQPKEATSEDDPINPRREVFNYLKALNQASETDLPLSLRLIRELHKTLMSGVRGRDRTPGQFRQVQVAIGTNHRFVPPPPERVMECLDSLEKYFHAEHPTPDPLIDSFQIHYQFETIHPFSDGNGRVGRLLLAVMLRQWCGLSKPWVYMSDYYERHRDEYIQRLFEVSTLGAWDRWIEFCLRGLITQARDTIQRCERLREIKELFTKIIIEIQGSTRLNQIVEDVFQSPFVRIADLAKRLEVTYPTANKDVGRLVQADILRELPNVTPKTYYAPKVFRVAYEELD